MRAFYNILICILKVLASYLRWLVNLRTRKYRDRLDQENGARDFDTDIDKEV